MEWFKKIEVRGYTYHSSKVLMIVAFLIICIFALYSLNYTKFSGKTFYYTECHTSGMVNECHNAYYQSNLCREGYISSISPLCSQEFIPDGGHLGEKAPWFIREFTTISIAILFLVLLLNTWIFNKGFFKHILGFIREGGQNDI